MTRLAMIFEKKQVTYAAVARRAHLQPRTIRLIATGVTPLDNVPLGTVRKIAAALNTSVADLIQPEVTLPGDDSVSRGARLAAAIRSVMWPSEPVPYLTPVADEESDEIGALPADDYFGNMPVIDARAG
jgi:transcriptional regulator with XRE-family HTH domain